LDENLDARHKLCQDVEGARGDEAVDDGQAAVVVEGPDVEYDFVETGSGCLRKLESMKMQI